jgi:ATP-binding cassette subfamily F protein uup
VEKARRPKLERPTPLRARNRAQRDLDRLIGQIEALSAEIARLEGELGDSDLYRRDPRTFEDLTGRLARARVELDAAEHRWLDLAGQLEQASD